MDTRNISTWIIDNYNKLFNIRSLDKVTYFILKDRIVIDKNRGDIYLLIKSKNIWLFLDVSIRNTVVASDVKEILISSCKNHTVSNMDEMESFIEMLQNLDWKHYISHYLTYFTVLHNVNFEHDRNIISIGENKIYNLATNNIYSRKPDMYLTYDTDVLPTVKYNNVSEYIGKIFSDVKLAEYIFGSIFIKDTNATKLDTNYIFSLTNKSQRNLFSRICKLFTDLIYTTTNIFDTNVFRYNCVFVSSLPKYTDMLYTTIYKNNTIFIVNKLKEKTDCVKLLTGQNIGNASFEDDELLSYLIHCARIKYLNLIKYN